ncbi:rifin, partial [Plasmodium falciparum IGH-CR14]
VNNQRNHILTFHNQTTMSRLLCECELYSPTNYDSDPEMKRVMQQFVDRTTQRFHEYDERMKTTRQKCREQCDKEIQKIILKDKLEKQMEQHFDTLQTDIQSDAIPTCVCEKSIADKVEKGCLRCGGLLGGGIAPGWGLVSGLGYVGWTNYVTQTALQKGIEEGIKVAIEELGKLYVLSQFKLIDWGARINGTNFLEPNNLSSIVSEIYYMCSDVEDAKGTLFCGAMDGLDNTPNNFALKTITQEAAKVAGAAGKIAKSTEEAEITLANAESSYLYSAIGYSVTAILIIVLVMIIIYFILRYRRKKKMNKKAQYTKLLNQ